MSENNIQQNELELKAQLRQVSDWRDEYRKQAASLQQTANDFEKRIDDLLAVQRMLLRLLRDGAGEDSPEYAVALAITQPQPPKNETEKCDCLFCAGGW